MQDVEALADTAPEPGNEPPQADEDHAAYLAAAQMWSETWTPELVGDWPGTGYGPWGRYTPAEWVLLGLRMAADWDQAFRVMHAKAA